MKILKVPRNRQFGGYDCGSDGLLDMLAFAGVYEREDRVIDLARTTKRDGTSRAGVLRVFDYYGLPVVSGKMRPDNLRGMIDRGYPTLIAIQAYRTSSKPYRLLWKDGHWVVAIGYTARRIIFADPASFNWTWLADKELQERWHDEDTRRIRNWGCTLLVKGQFRPNATVHMD